VTKLGLLRVFIRDERHEVILKRAINVRCLSMLDVQGNSGSRWTDSDFISMLQLHNLRGTLVLIFNNVADHLFIGGSFQLWYDNVLLLVR